MYVPIFAEEIRYNEKKKYYLFNKGIICQHPEQFNSEAFFLLYLPRARAYMCTNIDEAANKQTIKG